MALLIDGYNLLHATDIFGPPGPGTELHRTRLALLDFLASVLNKRERGATTIVFDAAGAPPGLPQRLQHDSMNVEFARGYPDADALLEELLDRAASPRTLTVVSGDHRVQRAARQHGAKYIDSDAWLAAVRAKRRLDSAADASPSKPVAAPTPDQVLYWLEKFSEPLPEDKKLPRRRNLRSPPVDRPAPEPRPEKSPKKSHRKKPRPEPSDKPIFGEGIFPPGYGDDLLE